MMGFKKIENYNEMLQILYSPKTLLIFIQNKEEVPFSSF